MFKEKLTYTCKNLYLNHKVLLDLYVCRYNQQMLYKIQHFNSKGYTPDCTTVVFSGSLTGTELYFVTFRLNIAK